MSPRRDMQIPDRQTEILCFTKTEDLGVWLPLPEHLCRPAGCSRDACVVCERRRGSFQLLSDTAQCQSTAHKELGGTNRSDLRKEDFISFLETRNIYGNFFLLFIALVLSSVVCFLLPFVSLLRAEIRSNKKLLFVSTHAQRPLGAVTEKNQKHFFFTSRELCPDKTGLWSKERPVLLPQHPAQQ